MPKLLAILLLLLCTTHRLSLDQRRPRPVRHIELCRTWPESTPPVHHSVTPRESDSSYVKEIEYRHELGTGEPDHGNPVSAALSASEPRWLLTVDRGHDVRPIFHSVALIVPGAGRNRGIAIGIAYPYLAAFFLILPALALSRRIYLHLRTRRRRARGLCPACAYDLRAHPPAARCPECGTSSAAPSRQIDTPSIGFPAHTR